MRYITKLLSTLASMNYYSSGTSTVPGIFIYVQYSTSIVGIRYIVLYSTSTLCAPTVIAVPRTSSTLYMYICTWHHVPRTTYEYEVLLGTCK